MLEAGFLAAFLGPASTPVPALLIWLFRWLLFRLEFGAGLIKMRGDPCWRDLTCLYYHHETQPMPNPLSWYFHHLPKPLHRIEVAGSHFAQLVAPVLLFFPQPIATFAGLVMAVTQSWLVLSGNFSWLNLTTIVLTASAMDDGVLARVLPLHPRGAAPLPWFDAVVLAVTALVVVLSWRPARNLFSRDQIMNASFDPLRLVNTYGAFGRIERERYEIAIEGTSDERIAGDTVWREYEFRGKPTALDRRPAQWAPYHLRLDWLMWFAALSPAYAEPWLGRLVRKLLENDRAILRLIRRNPFPDRPPRGGAGHALPVPVHHAARAPRDGRVVDADARGTIPGADEAAAAELADAEAASQRAPRGVQAAHPMDARAGRRRRRAEIQVLRRRGVGVDGEDGPGEELHPVVGAAGDVSSGAVRVVRLDLAGSGDGARQHGLPESRREPLELRLDARSHVHRRAVGDVAVGPEGVLSRGRTGVVEEALLRDEDEGSLGMLAAGDGGLARGDLLETAADVHGARAAAVVSAPGNRGGEGVVELEHARSAPESAQRAAVGLRQPRRRDPLQDRGGGVEEDGALAVEPVERIDAIA
ncbi:MAG TPA: lipase maturation factor family protein, partial [Myxococcales bacterium]|nr:lipase maturation factor family protein [Myxococcales bacterium]